jgi:uncharacterized membrane protein YagU involved in acid resistance
MEVSFVTERGIGTRVLVGAWAGVIAGVLFGAVMPAEEMMPMVAALYGLDGVAAGWAMHLVHSAVFGAVFAVIAGVALRGWGERPALAPLPAALFGVVLWLVAASFVMPAWIGAVTEMAPPVPDWNWLSLVGHVVYGVGLGVVYATTARLAWGTRERTSGAAPADGETSAAVERTRPRTGSVVSR